MTAAQRVTLEQMVERRSRLMTAGFFTGRQVAAVEADALRAALGTCGNCAHADTDDTAEGWCFCAAPSAGNRFHNPASPFRYRLMPLGERCTGWTAKEGA